MNNRDPVKYFPDDSNFIYESIKTRKGSVKEIRAAERAIRRRKALERRIKRKQEVREEITPSVRKTVFARYGEICYLCGKVGSDTIDHVVPLIKGGSNELKNLRPAHKACNKEKGAKIIVLPEELEVAGW